MGAAEPRVGMLLRTWQQRVSPLDCHNWPSPTVPAIFGGAFQGHSRRLASSPPSSLRRRSLEALSLPPEAAGLPVHAARLQAWYANADVARNGFVVGGSCN